MLFGWFNNSKKRRDAEPYGTTTDAVTLQPADDMMSRPPGEQQGTMRSFTAPRVQVLRHSPRTT